MDVVSTGPLKTASLLWMSRPGTPVLTVVCKATFRLQPDESPLAEEQDAPLEEDMHWNEDRSRSVYAPSDLAPFKPRADVLLVGSAFAPRKEPVRSLVARLIVADIDKAIEVFGERTLTRDGQLRDGFPFAKMPLRYERAAGGPETANPVGMSVDAQPSAQGTISLPNLQPRALSLTGSGDEIPPIGFGPIAASWPSRLAALGRHAGAWPQAGWTDRPMPEGVMPTYFNVAPADQQIESIRDTERILLENLHPEFPRLATALPGLRPRAMVERRGSSSEELKLKADTLWIDTDRGICTLTWRGQVPLKHRVEPGRVAVSVDQPVTRLLRGALQTPTTPPERLSPMPSPQRPATARISALSFGDTFSSASEAGTPRAGQLPPPPMSDRGVASSPTPKRLSIEAMLENTLATNGSGNGNGNGAQGSQEDDGDREVVSMSEVSPVDGTEQLRGPPTTASPGPIPQAPLPRIPTRSLTMPAAPMPTKSEIAQAKNARAAAAAAEIEPDPVTPPRGAVSGTRNPREVLKLIWVDAKCMPRLREHRRWKALLGQGPGRGGGAGGGAADDSDVQRGGAASSETATASPRDRRDALSLLARAEQIREGGVKQAIAAAVSDEGTIEPPIVLVAGELELPFDELAALRTTVMAASLLTTADEGLQEALDMAREFLKSPWPPGSGALVSGILSRVRGALSTSSAMAAHTERMLLEQRSYQSRTVFGRRWIRGLLRSIEGAPEVTTVYLPEALRDELPLYKKIRVKILGEADLQEDEAETSGCVIKAIALGRVADMP